VKRTRAEGKDFQEWIQYDIEYVEKMGPIFDVWLCILTVVNIVRSLIGAVASKIGFRGRDPRNA
jgi:lipopolysaccharide/colanic/teichoic acid biosynthesis glycosyltransferase